MEPIPERSESKKIGTMSHKLQKSGLGKQIFLDSPGKLVYNNLCTSSMLLKTLWKCVEVCGSVWKGAGWRTVSNQ